MMTVLFEEEHTLHFIDQPCVLYYVFSDAIENESDYVHPPTVAGEQEQANVYDVINPIA